MIGPSRKVGHPILDWRRKAIMERFGLTLHNPVRDLTQTVLDQLDRCKDDASRRLLLSIGRKA
jgi:hypothetical protein